jgi:F0F1-type ATP synthase membrane subunit b/b'
MKNQSVDLAVLIAQKILEEQLNLDKQNLIIDKFIEEVGASHW